METFDTVTQMVENRSTDVSLPAIYRSYPTLKYSNYTMYRPWKPLGEVLEGVRHFQSDLVSWGDDTTQAIPDGCFGR
jgi:hypothetical protein